MGSNRFRLIVLIALLAALAVPAAAPVKSSVGLVYQVNSNLDAVDGGAPDGICAVGAGGPCTLREAIREANVNVTAQDGYSITFASTVTQIILTERLGTLLITGNNIRVDGGGDVIIDGAQLPVVTSLIRITGSGNTLQYLTLLRATFASIIVGDKDTLTDRTSIFLNLIGVASSSQAGCTDGAGASTGSAYGVIVFEATNTLIQGNYIGCQQLDGVAIYQGAGAPEPTTIISNLIGVSMNSALTPNGGDGISAAGANGMIDIRQNTISGNAGNGIYLNGTDDAIIKGNRIGTGVAGALDRGNGKDGILLVSDAVNNTIGAAGDDGVNVISGNAGSGIHISGSSAANTIQHNIIGLSSTNPTQILPNAAGIFLEDAQNTVIGSADPALPQYISGNTAQGIRIDRSPGTVVGANNTIGLPVGSSEAGFGNGGQGIWVNQASNCILNPGTVAYNGAAAGAPVGAGIAITGAESHDNTISFAASYGNAGLPVDLGGDGPTLNGASTPPGPNDWVNYPSAMLLNGVITGQTYPNAAVDIYATDADPRASGGSAVYIASVPADASGRFAYPPSDANLRYTLIATDAAGNSSELSPVVLPARAFLPVLMRQ